MGGRRVRRRGGRRGRGWFWDVDRGGRGSLEVGFVLESDVEIGCVFFRFSILFFCHLLEGDLELKGEGGRGEEKERKKRRLMGKRGLGFVLGKKKKKKKPLVRLFLSLLFDII